jgi:hypothetical protein
MVILEALQYGVPVLAATCAGALEQLKTPLRVSDFHGGSTLEMVTRILDDESAWHEQADRQWAEFIDYQATPHASQLLRVWSEALARREHVW